jgi:hypothetical protein
MLTNEERLSMDLNNYMVMARLGPESRWRARTSRCRR